MGGETEKRNGDYGEILGCNCFALRRTARMATQVYDSHLRAAGLRTTQFILLGVMANNGALPMTKLAEAADLERTGLTRNLRILESKGWIVFKSGSDRRRRLVDLTREGQAKLDEAIPFWRKAQRRLERQIGVERLSLLRNELRELSAATRR